jgi:hypothetical protein
VVGVYDSIGGASDFDAGADIFWKPNGRFQMTATLNPDFGQVARRWRRNSRGRPAARRPGRLSRRDPLRLSARCLAQALAKRRRVEEPR